LPDSVDKRINILNQKEVEEVYGFPRFSDEERIIYFALTPPEQQLVDIHRSMASKVCCILQLGYFKASKMFFDLDEAERDVRWVIEHYFPESKSINIKIPKSTRIDQQARILESGKNRGRSSDVIASPVHAVKIGSCPSPPSQPSTN